MENAWADNNEVYGWKSLLDHIYLDMKSIPQLIEITMVKAEYVELTNIIAF